MYLAGTVLTAEGGASLGETTMGGIAFSSVPEPSPVLASANPTVDNCRINGLKLPLPNPNSVVPLVARLLLPFRCIPSVLLGSVHIDGAGALPLPL